MIVHNMYAHELTTPTLIIFGERFHRRWALFPYLYQVSCIRPLWGLFEGRNYSIKYDIILTGASCLRTDTKVKLV